MIGRGHIHVGTSGWHYRHWRGPFYPESLTAGAYLAYYSKQLRTVEINNTFYRLPSQKAFTEWREGTPNDFIFAVKASRFITHMKKLKDPGKPVSSFIERIQVLGDKLGPVLFQLPPGWRANTERLREFLQVLPAGYRYGFEFRDPGWFDPEVYRILRDHGTAFCIYDFGGRLSPRVVTAEFIYIRLHGPGGPYRGQYSEAQLAQWAETIFGWLMQGNDVYCYFDNDEKGYAARDALRLNTLVECMHAAHVPSGV